MAKLNFQHHYSSLQCHMILQKSFWYADLLLQNIYSYYQRWQQLCLIFFVETVIFYSRLFDCKAVKIFLFFYICNIFAILIFYYICYIVNIFNATFGQFNASLLNKIIHFLLKKNLLTPIFWTVVYVCVCVCVCACVGLFCTKGFSFIKGVLAGTNWFSSQWDFNSVFKIRLSLLFILS